MSNSRNFTMAYLSCMDTDKYLSTSQHPCGERKCCNYQLIEGKTKYTQTKRAAQSSIDKAMPFLIPDKHPEDMVNFFSRITLLEVLQKKKPKQLFSSQYAEWMWFYFLTPIPILTESAIAKF